MYMCVCVCMHIYIYIYSFDFYYHYYDYDYDFTLVAHVRQMKGQHTSLELVEEHKHPINRISQVEAKGQGRKGYGEHHQTASGSPTGDLSVTNSPKVSHQSVTNNPFSILFLKYSFYSFLFSFLTITTTNKTNNIKKQPF